MGVSRLSFLGSKGSTNTYFRTYYQKMNMKNKLKNIKIWHIGITKTYIDLFSTGKKDEEEFAKRIVDSLEEGDRKIVFNYIQNYINHNS